MPTKQQARMFLIGAVGFTMAMCLVRLWAARRSTEDGMIGLVADGVNAAL